MLQINVAQLIKEPIGAIRNLNIGGDSDVVEGNAVQGEAKLLRTNNSILVTGRLTTEIPCVCSSCLTSFKCSLAFDIEEEFFPTKDISSGAALPAPDQPGSFTIDEHHLLDLTEAVRQYILLAAPMRPLCRPDCAGLCPICGQNLNEASCSCTVEFVDPRLARLKDLVGDGGML